MSEIVGSELKKPELLHKINGYYKMDLEVLLVISLVLKFFKRPQLNEILFFLFHQNAPEYIFGLL